MSDSSASGFGKFVPGFDFLQSLAGQAAGGIAQGIGQNIPQLPNLSHWVAPMASTPAGSNQARAMSRQKRSTRARSVEAAVVASSRRAHRAISSAAGRAGNCCRAARC